MILGPPSGIFTFTTRGIPHIQIEREFAEMLDRIKRQAIRNDRKKMAADGES